MSLLEYESLMLSFIKLHEILHSVDFLLVVSNCLKSSTTTLGSVTDSGGQHLRGEEING